VVEHIWSVLCADSVIDKDSNNVSIHSVLEQINIQGKPPGDGEKGLVPQPFQLVSLFSRREADKPEKAACRLKIMRPNGELLKDQTFDVDLTQNARMRFRNFFMGLGVHEPGIIRFCIELKQSGNTEWDLVAQIPLDVRFSGPDSSV